ncbi:MAG TPA: glutathione S-transferase, partial [Roseibacterium sp.]|nr:glutathione S-transferase [Roseibacterium sp.]
APIALWESGAILIYLGEKSGQLLGASTADKYQIIKWVMFQMGGLGPMLGQLGYFSKFAGAEIEDPRPKARYVTEAKRLLAVLDGELANRNWIAGDYSIADIAIAPWLKALDYYGTKDVVGWSELKNLPAYLDRFLARAAVQKGLLTPPPPEG